nr:hypothetical protein [Tanacetum cinerariifolium]
MSTLTFAKTHNLIAFLEKPSENDGFEKIVNFLNANQIKYALTVVITEASIRHDLKLNDAEGTSCLPNAVIFKELARMGAKTTSWNEFSSTMASAIICLANKSKVQLFKFSRAVTPLFDIMMVQAVKEAGDLPTIIHDTPIPDAPSSSRPQRKYKPRRKERRGTKVFPTELHTENHVPTTSNDPLPSEMKLSHKAKIAELESKVGKLKEENMSLTKDLKSFNTIVESSDFKETVVDKEEPSKQGRKITDTDADAEVNLEDDADVSAAPINITTAQPSKATKTSIDITTAPKAKGIVFHDMEESTTRTASSKPQVKYKGKAKLVEEPKVLKLRKAQITINEEVGRIKLLNRFKIDNQML